MGNLKLEVGKFYRTRNELKAECVFHRETGCNFNFVCFVINELYIYHVNGSREGDDGSHLDIISEWEETPEDICKRIGFDPACLPAWANWIAMYENRKWVYLEDEPEQMTDFFYAEKGHRGHIPKEYAPKNYTGDWKDSKFKVK